MAKIIQFPGTKSTLEEFLQEAIEVMKEMGVGSCLMAEKTAEGEVVTAYHDCGFGTRQELCSHIQVDIIDSVVRANLE